MRSSERPKISIQTVAEAAREQREWIRELEDRKIKAQGYFDRSDFRKLAEKLIADNRKNKKNIKMTNGPFYPLSYENVGLNLFWFHGLRGPWDERLRSGATREWKEVFKVVTIECDQFGTITVGKKRGNIKIPFSEWNGNPAVQEKALIQAFNNPREVTEEKRAYIDFHRKGVPTLRDKAIFLPVWL